jgi:hypothetical protein
MAGVVQGAGAQVVDGGVVAVAVDCCLKELYPLVFQ